MRKGECTARKGWKKNGEVGTGLADGGRVGALVGKSAQPYGFAQGKQDWQCPRSTVMQMPACRVAGRDSRCDTESFDHVLVVEVLQEYLHPEKEDLALEAEE